MRQHVDEQVTEHMQQLAGAVCELHASVSAHIDSFEPQRYHIVDVEVCVASVPLRVECMRSCSCAAATRAAVLRAFALQRQISRVDKFYGTTFVWLIEHFSQHYEVCPEPDANANVHICVHSPYGLYSYTHSIRMNTVVCRKL